MRLVKRPSLERPIVYVEDDPITRKVIPLILHRMWGFDIRTAETGELAMDLLQAVEPWMFIMDFQTPGLCGENLLKAVRARPEWTDLPIVIYSSSATLDERQLRADYGVEAVIRKGAGRQPEDQLTATIMAVHRKLQDRADLLSVFGVMETPPRPAA